MSGKVHTDTNAGLDIEDAMLEQVAALRARSAIARWQLGAPPLSDHGGLLLRTRAQARWFQHQERAFERWLLDGGLQRDETPTAPTLSCVD